MITSAAFNKARSNLSSFMLRKADNVAKQIGFGYRDCDNAPGDFEALQAAYKASKQSGLALPVWNGCSDNTVYTSCGANYAFRFWHDVLHCVHGLGFTLQDEITIGLMHHAEVVAYFGPDSIEAKIIYADTVLQSEYEARHGQFPANQLEFVTNSVMYPNIFEIVYMACL